ncbi:uncharacterized protein LOC108627363 isoform X2 [Ceratina calcarata]|uniref:Uncharacterized protein LOC108627363 isoform X2 n=1 Tax=Ceratina calcarata TaxID=156304 RepID=A0AAJ7J4M5_9HYME|nr:uncharacterized protein LOC108627363 isoform X2 [Ceratina calcarata]
MHFWINKPAGRYYGFAAGRRYPATPLPKTRFNRHRHNADLRQTVTPLHRFQNLNTMGNAAGPSNVHNCRVIRTMIRPNNDNENNCPVGSTQRSQLDNTSNNVTTAGNNQLILSNPTSNGTNRSLLDFSEFNDAELASYKLRCGVWITFVLATGFVAAAKFYFSDRSQDHPVQEEHITSAAPGTIMPNENIRSISIVRQNPPPPYHIAILIPPHNTADEAPPPSYDKVIYDK